MHNTDLGRRSPRGGCVLYKVKRTFKICGHAFLPRLVDLASLMCGMNWWPIGRSSVSAFWFDL